MEIVMIVINTYLWNARKLSIINQVINNMPEGAVSYKIRKLFLLHEPNEIKHGGFNSSF